MFKRFFRKKNNEILDKLQQENFQLREIIDNFPGDVYWKNRDGVWLGVNKRGRQSLKEMGFLSGSQHVIGKTDQEIFGEKTAQIYRDNDWVVMNENREVSLEEVTTLPTGEQVVKYSTKKPLYTQNQEIVGIIGSSMDITAQKEAEKLRLANTEQEVKIEEQDKFYKVASQLSHDIRSPLSALKILHEQIAHKLTENERVMERNALTRLTDILNSGFIRYKSEKEISSKLASEEKEYFMVSTALEQILAEKRLEYQHCNVTFDINFESSAIFAFFQVKISAFKRMMSNLINNAMDALEDRVGKISIHLRADGYYIYITVEDNGKGMSDTVKAQILNDIVVTSGKAHGNGIGFTQIRDTLKEHDAKLSITAQADVGTSIHLTFLQTEAPAWAIDHIELYSTDTVVVVDDDPSIHDAWDTRFLADGIDIAGLKHFQQGKEAIQFIKNLSADEKKSLFLLTDYELLGQAVNGLDIVEQTHVKRTVLVTSHSDEEAIRERALLLNTKILPKLLASNIPIGVSLKKDSTSSASEIVIIDDDNIIRDTIRLLAFPGKTVHQYADPFLFLENMRTHSKTTLFLIDYHFANLPIKGTDIAEELHKAGYLSIYLFSGEEFQDTQIPPYLKIIKKTDTDKLIQLGNTD